MITNDNKWHNLVQKSANISHTEKGHIYVFSNYKKPLPRGAKVPFFPTVLDIRIFCGCLDFQRLNVRYSESRDGMAVVFSKNVPFSSQGCISHPFSILRIFREDYFSCFCVEDYFMRGEERVIYIRRRQLFSNDFRRAAEQG